MCIGCQLTFRRETVVPILIKLAEKNVRLIQEQRDGALLGVGGKSVIRNLVGGKGVEWGGLTRKKVSLGKHIASDWKGDGGGMRGNH